HLQQSSDGEQQRLYAELIWQGLSRAREPLDLEQLPPQTSTDVRGWIALGRIGQGAWQDPYGFAGRLDNWSRRYAGHPAERLLLETVREEHLRRFAYPETVALLLPLSGRFRASSEAVRDGFLAAVYQHAAHRPAPRVLLFDTGGNAQAT